MNRHQAIAYHNKIVAAAEILPDEQAVESVKLFETWSNLLKKGKEIPVKKRCRDEDILYECIQLHTPQVGWNPKLTPNLWKRVSVEKWPEWVQPYGSEDAYKKGAKVSHNGQHWISNYDNNVWEPGVYGWIIAQENN